MGDDVTTQQAVRPIERPLSTPDGQDLAGTQQPDPRRSWYRGKP